MAENIRNFSIIAHIDHGKSTLADRMLELTGTVPMRKMKEQVLDQMELERERGITIKMQPVRMNYNYSGKEYVLNLIDTPGHIDFSYEVSRALQCVEGAILLVDATQGVQAQTITNLDIAKQAALTIVPVINKTDLANARPDEVCKDVANRIGNEERECLNVSAKTGFGVEELLKHICDIVPQPRQLVKDALKSLIFDFEYSNHQGVVLYVRVFSGEVKNGDALTFLGSKKKFIAHDVGIFQPEKKKTGILYAGEIGYIVTGVKEPHVSFVGDTVTHTGKPTSAIPGFRKPSPLVWASVYPEGQDDFPALTSALSRLSLSDSALHYEEEGGGALGRGYRLGFLGMLHLEIIVERLKREYFLSLVVTAPTVSYDVTTVGGDVVTVYTPSRFPLYGTYTTVIEPWILANIITPSEYIGGVLGLAHEHGGEVGETETLVDGRARIEVRMPLSELMRNFFDELKSISSGYASLSYDMLEKKIADVARMDILVANEIVPAFSKIIPVRRLEKEGRELVARLHGSLPRQQFPVKIQAKTQGRIIASKTLPALRKDVTGYLYGGDITRKKKLLEKQKKGKKKLTAGAKVTIPHSVYVAMLRNKT